MADRLDTAACDFNAFERDSQARIFLVHCHRYMTVGLLLRHEIRAIDVLIDGYRNVLNRCFTETRSATPSYGDIHSITTRSAVADEYSAICAR